MQRVSLALLILMACLAAGPVRAACSNPAGNEADQLYNKDYHTYEFCNGSQWIAFGGVGSVGGPSTFVVTQTASSSASLQFTSLPTSYNTLFLNCTGLMLSSGTATLALYLGEGATPTWETGGHYTAVYFGTGENGGAGAAAVRTLTGTDVLNGQMNDFTTGIPASIKLYIDNVASSSIIKMITWNFSDPYNTVANNQWGWSGWTFWNNDTNPITGLELVPSTGTITSGACSLYGMN
jgi:hypothetical protein